MTTLRRVTVAMTGDSYESVDAYVCGEWAAHKRPKEQGWTVTYIASSRRCTSFQLTEEQSRKLAEWLNSHVTRDEMLDWGHTSPETAAKVRMGVELAVGREER